jgi:O-antigen/teichoic acid export membrane protein
MSSDDDIPRSGRLEEKAVRGVFSTVLMFASNKVITFGTTLVLARILTPSDFGIVALASVTIGLLALFSDLGLGGTLVVRKHLDDRISGTIFTLMLLMGLLTALLVAGTAPLAASIFDEPDLTPILAVLGATVILNAPTWFYSTILQRELEFWRRFQCQLAQSVTYAAVAIGAAIAGAGVWALVAGQVAGTLVFTVTLAAVSPYRIRPSFDRDSAGTAIREGRGFLAQSGLAYVELNADYMSVGGFLGSAQLGYYSMAFRIAELPYWAITEPVAKVTFPGFARMRHRGESVTASFLSVLRLVALVACPTGILLSATAEPFTITVYGSQWLPMAGVLAILGVWGTLNHIEASIGWLMNSVGRAGLNAGTSAATLPAFLAGVILAAAFGDIEIVAWVLLAHVVVSLVIRMWAAARWLEVPVAAQWRAVRPVLFGCAVAWVAARVVSDTLPWVAPLTLAAALLAGACAYLAVISAIEPGVVRRSIAQLRRTLQRRGAASEGADDPVAAPAEPRAGGDVESGLAP